MGSLVWGMGKIGEEDTEAGTVFIFPFMDKKMRHKGGKSPCKRNHFRAYSPREDWLEMGEEAMSMFWPVDGEMRKKRQQFKLNLISRAKKGPLHLLHGFPKPPENFGEQYAVEKK